MKSAAWIALGSNLGDPLQHLRDAIGELSLLPDSSLAGVSSFYRSAPMGPQDQPDYLNAVARLDTALPPAELLRQLQAIEQAHGRDRDNETRWGARALDLDILLYGQQQCRSKDLTIPHPELTERAFVLYPLHEMAPDLDIPGCGDIKQFLPAVAGQQVEALHHPNAT